MEISTLLVPVVGGYIALFITNATRYYIVRQTGYPQFFFSVLAGAILLFLSRLITNSFSGDYPQIECWWSQMAPMAYSGTLAITLELGIVAPLITNVVVGWFIDKDALVIAAANRHGNMFDSILESALGTNSFVQLNTQGRKVYIGIPQRVTAPLGNSTEITIMPFVSGFLDGTSRAGLADKGDISVG